MTIQTFIYKIKQMDYPQSLDKDYDGACPCFSVTKTIEGKRVHILGRCWRVSENMQDLYVWGNLPERDLRRVGRELKKQLDKQEWYNKYTVMLRRPE